MGHHWPNIECWLGSFVIFKGIETSIAKKPNISVIFQGGGGPDPLSPLWTRPWYDQEMPQSQTNHGTAIKRDIIPTATGQQENN